MVADAPSVPLETPPMPASITGCSMPRTSVRRVCTKSPVRSVGRGEIAEDPFERREVAGEWLGRTGPVDDQVGDARRGVGANRVMERLDRVEAGCELDSGQHELGDRRWIAVSRAAGIVELGDLRLDDARA